MTPETDVIALAVRRIEAMWAPPVASQRVKYRAKLRAELEKAYAAGAEKEREYWRRLDAEKSRNYAEGYERATAEGAEEALARHWCYATETERVVEYARNIDAIWYQPHADTAFGLANHHRDLSRGAALLRDALADLDAARKEREKTP
jgi:hypothetical protein